MNKRLILKILSNPTPIGLQESIDREEVPEEIIKISQFDKREVLNFTGTVGPPQFQALMAAYRLTSYEVVLRFVIECALRVLPVAQRAYPQEQLLVQFSMLASMPLKSLTIKVEELKSQIKRLCDKAERDSHESKLQILAEKGFIPIDQAHEISRGFGAMSVLLISCIIILEKDLDRLPYDVDGVMSSLMLVYQGAEDELGQWMVSRLSELVESSN